MIKRELIEELAEERIQELNNGCYLVDINIDGANKIVVEVDKEEGSIAVEDCVSISRNIEHNLDREEQDFSLEVTSPGLSKPFKIWRQYKKNIGRRVKVQPVEGEKLEGTIKEAGEDKFVLEVESKKRIEGRKKKEKVIETYDFMYDQIKETKVVIAFK